MYLFSDPFRALNSKEFAYPYNMAQLKQFCKEEWAKAFVADVAVKVVQLFGKALYV